MFLFLLLLISTVCCCCVCECVCGCGCACLPLWSWRAERTWAGAVRIMKAYYCLLRGENENGNSFQHTHTRTRTHNCQKPVMQHNVVLLSTIAKVTSVSWLNKMPAWVWFGFNADTSENAVNPQWHTHSDRHTHTNTNTLTHAANQRTHTHTHTEAGGSVTSHRPAAARGGEKKGGARRTKRRGVPLQPSRLSLKRQVWKNITKKNTQRERFTRALRECVITCMCSLGVLVCVASSWDGVWGPRRPNSPWRDPYAPY